MGAIFTGDLTKFASDTSVVVYAGDSFVVQIEIFPFLDSANGASAQRIDRMNSLCIEIIVEPIDQILNDSKSIVHHRRTNLQTRGTESNELGRIPPGPDTADSRNGKLNILI